MVANVIYHIGNDMDSETIVKKGKIYTDDQTVRIESDHVVFELENIEKAELCKMNGLGTMIKIIYENGTIFLSVPRIFINVGTGFAIINYFATKKLFFQITSLIS